MPRRRLEFESGDHPKDDASLGTPGAGVEDAKLEKFSDEDGSQIQWLSDAGRFTLFEWEQYISLLRAPRLCADEKTHIFPELNIL